MAGVNHCPLSLVFSRLPTPIAFRLFDTQSWKQTFCLFFWRTVFRAAASRRVHSGVGLQAMWGPLKGTNKDKSQLVTGVERGAMLSFLCLQPLTMVCLLSGCFSPQSSLPWLSSGSFLCSVSVLNFRVCLWPCVCPAVPPYLIAQVELPWRFQGAGDGFYKSHRNERPSVIQKVTLGQLRTGLAS